MLVPQGDVTSLGSAIFAFLAAGTFKNIEEAQDAMCPGYRTVEPEEGAVAVYQRVVSAVSKAVFRVRRSSDR